MATILIDKNVMVPMRDGVRLATDVYRLDGAAPAPVLLARTPYDKEHIVAASNTFDIMRAVQAGYVVVIQDVRGRFASEREFGTAASSDLGIRQALGHQPQHLHLARGQAERARVDMVGCDTTSGVSTGSGLRASVIACSSVSACPSAHAATNAVSPSWARAAAAMRS